MKVRSQAHSPAEVCAVWGGGTVSLAHVAGATNRAVFRRRSLVGWRDESGTERLCLTPARVAGARLRKAQGAKCSVGEGNSRGSVTH